MGDEECLAGTQSISKPVTEEQNTQLFTENGTDHQHQHAKTFIQDGKESETVKTDDRDEVNVSDEDRNVEDKEPEDHSNHDKFEQIEDIHGGEEKIADYLERHSQPK